MKVQAYRLVLVLLMCGLTASQADVFSVPLTGNWLGDYNANTYYQEAIDLQSQFSSIQGVSISWVGSVTTGYDMDILPVRACFVSTLVDGGNSVASASSPWSSQNYSFPTVNFNTQTGYSANSWDFLLDGRVTLEIDCVPESNNYANTTKPWGHLQSASFIVDGTPVAVPEPSGILAIAVGLSGLAGVASRRRRA